MADAKDIDLATLKKCLPKAKEANLAKFIEGINETFDTFDMINPQRQAMFLAQTAHESGNFRYTEENLNYSGSTLMRVLENPEMAKDNPVAVLSAGWFWETRRLNRWCDKGDVKKVTRLINGGTNGLKDREQHYNHILHVLS